MEAETKCPSRASQNVHHDVSLWIFPDCAHEWNPDAAFTQASGVRDAHGNALADGDRATVVKDPKVKGIRLVEASDGHDIACRIDGIDATNLGSEFVKKA